MSNRTTIISDSNDSYQGKVGVGATWLNTRQSTSGTSMHNGLPSFTLGTYTRYLGGRGPNNFYINRSYFEFDCSISKRHVNNAYFSFYLENRGSTGNHSAVVLVASNSLDDHYDDYNNVLSGTFGAMGVKLHSIKIQVGGSAGFYKFKCSAEGIALIQHKIESGDTLTVGLVSDAYDYQNYAPTLGGDYNRVNVYYSDTLGDTYSPKLVIDFDDAIFFGANF